MCTLQIKGRVSGPPGPLRDNSLGEVEREGDGALEAAPPNTECINCKWVFHINSLVDMSELEKCCVSD